MILTGKLHLIYTVLVFLTFPNFQAFRNGSSVAFAAENEDSLEKKNATRVPLFAQREYACYDRSPHCNQWAAVGECRKRFGRQYMIDNCLFSCNMCNPNMEKWIPQPTNTFTKMTFESQDELEYTITTGIPQTVEFEDTPLIAHTDKNMRNNALSVTKRRLSDVLVAQNHYLDKLYEDHSFFSTEKQDYIYHSSIDIDLLSEKKVTSFPLPEMCTNRNALCAVWATEGFCDTKPMKMAKICGPMCHMCRRNRVANDKIFIEDISIHSSPFLRNDLHGVLEAIKDDRIIIDWAFKYAEKDPSLLKYVMTERRFVNGDYMNALHVKNVNRWTYKWDKPHHYQEYYQELLGSNETSVFTERYIAMYNFTSDGLCGAILNAVKFGVGTQNRDDPNGELSDDGFPQAVRKTFYTGEENGSKSEVEVRHSSRLYMNPAMNTEDGKRFAPAIERLLEKLQLLVGAPRDHIEMPLIFEKFSVGEYRNATSFFKDSILTSEGQMFYTSTVEDMDEYILPNTLTRTKSRPDTMINPRVFGVTLFLNDVEEGGEVSFPFLETNNAPHVQDVSVGKAIIFPTVLSMNGQWNISEDESLDKNYNNDLGSSELFEDLTFAAQHNPVRKGVKYTLTVYFRRYASEYDDDEVNEWYKG